ncbi:MAG TPA: penicillin acylase family protein [Pseudomonadota bacterium]|nr:penicillin acylase family protein [Pseudomonadota bacterium]
MMTKLNAHAGVTLGLALTISLSSCGGTGSGLDADLGVIAAPPDGAPGSSPPIAAGENIFLSIVPPGSNGNSVGGIGSPIPGAPVVSYPKNFRDQLDMYGNLAHAKTPLKAEVCAPPTSITQHQKQSDQACNYFKRADLTIDPAEAVASRTLTAPNGKRVTIRRDGWGVPYVEGDDRGSAEYGLGFAAAQDRLWLFDLLRNVGRGRASQFLGPAGTTYDLDNEFGVPAGYSEQELTDMANNTVAKLGALGPIFLSDTQMFVAGMNAYVSHLLGPGALEIPLEYTTLAAGNIPKFPPPPFTVNDIVANAVMIQAALGRGGGGEASNLKLLQTLDPSITAGAATLPRAACELWRDLRHADLADTPHTIDKTFNTQSPPTLDESCPQSVPPGAALWDTGSYQDRQFLTHAPGLILVKGSKKPAKAAVMHASADGNSLRRLLNQFGLPMATSNWLAVSGSETKSGHPIAVMGPQTGYDVPQLLWEAAVVSHGGTDHELAARGISTLNLPYIVIGHGADFAWSPTSAKGDIQDTRVSKMCNLNGTPASRADLNADGFPDADGYMYKGRCVKFYKRLDKWTASPTTASLALGCAAGPLDPGCHPLPESVKRYILRTHYGPVVATALVQGQPVAISIQRSTFLSDLDSNVPFVLLTSPSKPMTPLRFKQMFNSMTSVFNWLYLDSKDIAYIQSGLYPQRHAGINPDLPQWGDGNFEWAADENLPANFFTLYGGDGNGTGKPFPARAVPVAQGDGLDGYFEWSGYLPLAAHVQETNPSRGYMANWNNSAAPGWWAADSNGSFGPTHRVQSLLLRLSAFKASGRKFDIGNMIEIMADAAYTDLRGYEVLPLILQILKQGPLTAEQQAVVELMQRWMDTGSNNWISSTPGLGSFRRDRDASGVYDFRAQVVLMDAWYLHMMDAVLPQLRDLDAKGAAVLTDRFDAPRAQGSAFEQGWFQHMKRVFQTVLGTPGHQDYRALKCAGTGTLADCRKALLDSLTQALTELGGLANQASWDGSRIPNAKGKSGAKVEDYDAVEHTSFSFLPVPPIHWINRPTFQQAVEIYKIHGQ